MWRKWLFIVPFILIIGVTTVLAFTLPPIYKSTTLILVEGQKVPPAYVKPTVTTSVQERLKTITQQIMSRTRLERIIKEFGLYSDRSGKYAIYIKKLGLDRWIRQSPPTMDDLVERMRKNISVKVMGKDAFTVSFTGKDPETVMKVTSTLASLFIEENLKVREEYAEGTSDFLAEELKRAKEKLESQEEAIKRFKQEHIGSLPEQLDANLKTLDRLQIALQSVRDTLKKDEEQKIMLQERLASLSNQQVMSGEVGLSVDPLEQELYNLKKELVRLRSVYKDTYPDVQMVKVRIKEIEEILKDRAGKEDSTKASEKTDSMGNISPISDPVVNGIKTQIDRLDLEIKSLKASESRLKKQIKVYEKRVEETPKNEQILASLTRDYNMTQQSYQSLLGKRLEAQLSANMEKRQKGEQFRVIDPANLPEKPFKPNRKMLVLIGIFLGLGCGLGLVYTVEYMSPVFRKPEDFIGMIDIPVLATIPRYSDLVLNTKDSGKS